MQGESWAVGQGMVRNHSDSINSGLHCLLFGWLQIPPLVHWTLLPSLLKPFSPVWPNLPKIQTDASFSFCLAFHIHDKIQILQTFTIRPSCHNLRSSFQLHFLMSPFPSIYATHMRLTYVLSCTNTSATSTFPRFVLAFPLTYNTVPLYRYLVDKVSFIFQHMYTITSILKTQPEFFTHSFVWHPGIIMSPEERLKNAPPKNLTSGSNKRLL